MTLAGVEPAVSGLEVPRDIQFRHRARMHQVGVEPTRLAPAEHPGVKPVLLESASLDHSDTDANGALGGARTRGLELIRLTL